MGVFRGYKVEVNKIYCESCLDTMSKMDDGIVDIILTSPPYNTNTRSKGGRTLDNINEKYYPSVRYDVYVDSIPNDEYISRSINLFNNFDRILAKDGVILYNMSYGNVNPHLMLDTLYNIIHNTNFSIADTIVWKKRTCQPIWSKNKLSRICEFIYVFCRSNEFKTFNSGKKLSSIRDTGVHMYEASLKNFIEAPNTDGPCGLINCARFSSELVCKLLKIYAHKSDLLVYDPFMGSGTTAVGCIKYGHRYVGSELSPKQVAYANKWIEGVKSGSKDKQYC